MSVCFRCCSGIVMDNTQARRDQMEENADHELKDLQRVRVIMSACLYYQYNVLLYFVDIMCLTA